MQYRIAMPAVRSEVHAMSDAELVRGTACELKKRSSTLTEYRKWLNKVKAAADDPRRVEVNRKLELLKNAAKTKTGDAHDQIADALSTAASALQRARDGVEVMAEMAVSYVFCQAGPPSRQNSKSEICSKTSPVIIP